jgi:hypothetical protein
MPKRCKPTHRERPIQAKTVNQEQPKRGGNKKTASKAPTKTTNNKKKEKAAHIIQRRL